MFSRIKIAIGAILTALIAFLGLAVKYQSNRADNAEQEAKQANTELDLAEKRIELHEQRQEIEDDVAMGDEPSIDDRLYKYYREEDS